MAQIKLFCEKFADSELKTRSEVVFSVLDEGGRTTYIVLSLNTENKERNFKNQLIADALYMWSKDECQISWLEIDDLITKIKRSGVLFL